MQVNAGRLNILRVQGGYNHPALFQLFLYRFITKYHVAPMILLACLISLMEF